MLAKKSYIKNSKKLKGRTRKLGLFLFLIGIPFLIIIIVQSANNFALRLRELRERNNQLPALAQQFNTAQQIYCYTSLLEPVVALDLYAIESQSEPITEIIFSNWVCESTVVKWNSSSYKLVILNLDWSWPANRHMGSTEVEFNYTKEEIAQCWRRDFSDYSIEGFAQPLAFSIASQLRFLLIAESKGWIATDMVDTILLSMLKENTTSSNEGNVTIQFVGGPSILTDYQNYVEVNFEDEACRINIAQMGNIIGDVGIDLSVEDRVNW